MAFEIIQDKEQPKFTVLSSYTVERVGEFPICRATFTECVYLTNAFVRAASVDDADGDGATERIIVPQAWNLTAQQLEGQYLTNKNNVILGQIVSAEIVNIPASTDDEGVVTPAVHEVRLAMNAPQSPSVAGTKVAVIKRMPTGALAYRKAQSGKEWSISLNGAEPAHLARMVTMLGAIYFKAIKSALGVFGVDKTDAEIFAALQTLAYQGINIDGLFAEAGDQLELDRRAGDLVGNVTPDAPTPND
jgi:hypothetical protein